MIGWLEALVLSGHAIDLVLLVMLGEGLLLWRRGKADLQSIGLALLPGALILLAARAAITGSGWLLIALPLALSFPVHLADLRRRGW
ncbi:MAG: hypothetical protein ACRC1J_00930 [Sandaracinobacteroides sp.]